MRLNWHRGSPSGEWLFILAVMTYAFGLMSVPAWAATNISGRVQDSITEQPLAGVQVSVSHGGTPLASGISANDGVFQLLVDIPVTPEPMALGLSVDLSGYDKGILQVIVTAGKANQLSYRFNLQRNEAKGCHPTWARTIVIGHVRPPTSATADLSLSQRIGEVLEYDLLAEVQKVRLPAAQQPVVLPCPDARPRNSAEQAFWAKALKADAFLVGTAEPVNNKFLVDLQVSARDGETAMPIRATTPLLNLDRPESANLGNAAMEPIVFALLAAYQKEGHFAECVEFAVAAQRLLGANPKLVAQRQACQARLPNHGLVSGGGQ